MTRKLRALLLSSALVIAAPSALAQGSDASEDTAEVLDTVIVQAARRDVPIEALPQTVQLIDTETIRAQSLLSTNLVDVIGQVVPSFSPSRQKLSGRGETFRGREPLYLIDGVPQSNPLRNGDRDGFTVDPAVIERIEVLFGANAIQGPGANSGIINYVTVSPEDGEDWSVRTEIGATLSSDFDGDGTGYRGAVTASRDFGQFDLVANFAGETRGAFYDGEGRRIGVDATQGDIQDSVTTNFFLKAGFDIDSNTRIQGSVNLFELEGDGDYVQIAGDRALDIPAISVRGDVEGQPPTNTVETYNLTFERRELFGGRLEAQLFYRTFESVFGGGTFGGFFNTGNEPDGVLTFDQSANNSDKTGAKLTYSHSDLAIEGLTLTGGLDYLEDETFQELIATGRLWVPETTLKSLAPFVQVDQSFLDGRGVVSFGVRYEDAEIEVGDYQTIFSSGAVDVGGGNPSFSETLYNAGASLEVLEGVKAYVSYGEVFTLPDVGRVLRAVSEPGLDVDNLLDVSPIVTDNIEVGVTVERGGLSANIAYFQSESDFGQRLALNDAGIFTVEREATEISGFEISADYVFDAVPLSIGAGYAALDGESDQDGDGSVETELDAVNIGPDRLNLFAEYEFSPAFSGRVQASSFLDKEFDDGRTDTDFDGYTLIDVIGIYDFGTIGTLQFGVQNLANEDYTTYFSQSSSQAVTRGDRFFQGRGRTFNLRWVNEF